MLSHNFLSTSQLLGADISAIQGAGGNISIKDNDIMFIKASGTWLADALNKNIFTKVSILDVLKAVDNGHENFSSLNNVDSLDNTNNGSSLKDNLRPSIETPLHAILPHSVVIHVHCIHTITHSLSYNAKNNLSTLLNDFSWMLVPYARPGLPLAHAVQKALYASPESDVFILQNHGLIVGGTDIEDAFAKFKKVREALNLVPRATLEPNLAFLESKNTLKWSIPKDNLLHSLALDKHSFSAAQQGVLYPDHAVFLGTFFPIADVNENAEQAYERLNKNQERAINYLIYPEKGILISPQNTQGQNALIHALAMVCARTWPNEKVLSLSPSDLNDLTNWEAEKYRQSLENARTN